TVMDRRIAQFACALVMVSLFVGCSASPGRTSDQAVTAGSTARAKILMVAIAGSVQSMGTIGSGTSAGGWVAMQEANSAGLVTSDFDSRRPIGRLADKAPTLEDGSISMLPDGRMQVIYRLRPGVTWHDGAPFTAEDMAFTYRLLSDRGIPSNRSDAV